MTDQSAAARTEAQTRLLLVAAVVDTATGDRGITHNLANQMSTEELLKIKARLES